jgi:hypothetical protein
VTLTIELVGVDGSVWPLMGLGPSPAKLANGLGGLHLPQVKHLWKSTARGSGQVWLGSRAQSRQFSLNVYIPDADDVPAFWEAVSTDELATLVVNGERSLAVRLDEDNQFDFTKDPYLGVDSVYPVHHRRPAGVAGEAGHGDVQLPGGGHDGLLRADGAGSAVLHHGGVAVRYGVGEQSGGSAGGSGVDGAGPGWGVPGGRRGSCDAAAVRFAVRGHGVIDTAAQTITDPTGNSLWPLMGYTPVDFAPVPPGDEVPIAIGMDGAGSGASISVSLTPRFRRAWGPTPGGLLAAVAPGGGGGSAGGFGVEPFGSGPFGE